MIVLKERVEYFSLREEYTVIANKKHKINKKKSWIN